MDLIALIRMISRQNATSTGIIWEKRSPLQFILPLFFSGGWAEDLFLVNEWAAGVWWLGACVTLDWLPFRGQAAGSPLVGRVCVCGYTHECVWQKEKERKRVNQSLSNSDRVLYTKTKPYLWVGSCQGTWDRGLSGAWCGGSLVMSHSGSSSGAARVWS